MQMLYEVKTLEVGQHLANSAVYATILSRTLIIKFSASSLFTVSNLKLHKLQTSAEFLHATSHHIFN